MLLKSWVPCFAVLTFLAVGAAQVHRLPKPQIDSSAGQLAPDFSLQDQSGNRFRLSSIRGNRVLLIFYRGYW
jgi:cytochrome oxidase Cu insertion factor (SCO1/SenC/PrrC family)